MKQIFSIVCFFLFCIIYADAQRVYRDYQIGKVYLKLKTYYNPKTREAIVPNYKFDLKNLPFYKQPPVARFGITKFGRGFTIDANDQLNSIMVLEFNKNI